MVDNMLNTVFTIGHGTAKLQSFIDNLNHYKNGETYIIDVRSVPYSSYVPQFNADYLKTELKKFGFHYVPMGKEFGARRLEFEAYNDNSQVDFNKTALLDSFQNGINRIKNGLALSCNLILMCSEKDPLECHRFALISRALSKEGIAVNHIIDNDVISQEQAEEELVIKYQSKIDFLFSSQAEQIEQAYALLNNAIGYKKV